MTRQPAALLEVHLFHGDPIRYEDVEYVRPDLDTVVVYRKGVEVGRHSSVYTVVSQVPATV